MVNKIHKKGMGMFGKLAGFIVAILFFVFIMVAFFADDGRLSIMKDKLLDVIRGVPEIDQDDAEMNFFRTNQKQIDFFAGWKNSITAMIESPAQHGGCIAELAPLEQRGFYSPDSNYNLYFTQNGPDIEMSLTMYAKFDNNDDDSQKVEKPVTTATIKGAQLCTLDGEAAHAFYEEFNDRKEGDAQPDAKKVADVISKSAVKNILISSGKDADKDLERSMGYFREAFDIRNEDDYTWAKLFKKKDRSIIYAVRFDNAGQKYICLIPAVTGYSASDLAGCRTPVDEGKEVSGTVNYGGIMDLSCFDRDAGKRTLKRNFDTGLIDSSYKCVNKNSEEE